MNKKLKGQSTNRTSSVTKKSSSSISRKDLKSKNPKNQLQYKKIDLNALNTSFSELQQTKLTKSSVEEARRKASTSKIIQVQAKLEVPSREIICKTSDDLSKLLKDF